MQRDEINKYMKKFVKLVISKKSTLLGLHDPEVEGGAVIQNLVTIYQLTWCNIAEVLIHGEAQQ